MAAPNYDEMSDTAEDPEEAAEEETAAEDASDDEFMMEAEAAGFTGEKAKALWRAVARCVELTQGGGMPMPTEEEGALD